MKNVLLLLVLLVGLVGTVHAQDDTLDTDELLNIAQRVVLIGIVENGEFVGNGSGTIIDPSGIIFTNRHVVEDADDLQIYILEDIGEIPVFTYLASVVEVSEQIDFAIIQIDRDFNGNPIDPQDLNLPFLPLEVASATIGEEVRVFGYPGIGDGYMVVTSGEIVTIQNGLVNGERVPVWYRTDSEFSGGNSGGLAVNNAGQPIGIPTWVVSEDRTAGKLGGLLPFSTVVALIQNANNLASGAESNDMIVEDIPEATGETVNFTLNNQSSLTVCFVQISPTSATEWGDDQLGENEVINGGASRTWELAADFYDIRLLDCNAEVISDTRNVAITEDIALDYTGDPESDAPPPASGQQSVSCGQTIQFDNGVEVIMQDLDAGEQIRVTALGLEGFDPVMAVFDAANEGRCSDDGEGAVGYTANLPSSGNVPASNLNSQLEVEGIGGTNSYSVIVGGYENQTGEFLVIIEGASLSVDDVIGDRYEINATSLGPNTTVTAYMIAEGNDLDVSLFLTNGEQMPLTDENQAVIYCDDAGNSNVCWAEVSPLMDSDLTLFGGEIIRGGNRDAALQLTPDNISTYGGSVLRLLATSYQQETIGNYVLVLHIGNR